MRTVTYGAACSLDGFIAAADGAIDWLHFSRDAQAVMAEYWATVDTVLMGRKTWAATPGADTAAMAEDPANAPAEPPPSSPSAITTYIFSRTLRRAPAGARRSVRALKQQPGKGICVMGGGELAQSLFDAGVIDEVGLNVHPVLLGAGVPLFRDVGHRVALELAESRVIDGGCVLSTYRVRPST